MEKTRTNETSRWRTDASITMQPEKTRIEKEASRFMPRNDASVERDNQDIVFTVSR